MHHHVSKAVVVPLYDCVFLNNGDAIHYFYEVDQDLYSSLSNLYVICIADRFALSEIRAALVMKTTLCHTDLPFSDAISALIRNSVNLIRKVTPKSSGYFPARIKADGLPLSQEELIQVTAMHYSQFSFQVCNEAAT